MKRRKYLTLWRLALIVAALLWVAPPVLAQIQHGPWVRNPQRVLKAMAEKRAEHAKRKAAAQRLKAKLQAAAAQGKHLQSNERQRPDGRTRLDTR